jgi:hypothetical protein
VTWVFRVYDSLRTVARWNIRQTVRTGLALLTFLFALSLVRLALMDLRANVARLVRLARVAKHRNLSIQMGAFSGDTRGRESGRF